jgi:hypothetical protein
MRRVFMVILIAALTTFMLGIDETSWAVQGAEVKARDSQRERVVQRLATLRRGATVEIQRTDGTRFFAVLQEIGPDEVTVMLDRGGQTATERIAIDAIRDIRPVSPQKVARSHKGLIVAAVVAGVVVVALVGACRTAAAPAQPRGETGPAPQPQGAV